MRPTRSTRSERSARSTKRRVAIAAIVGVVLAASAAWSATTPVTSQHLTVDAPDVCTLHPDADTYLDETSASSNFGTATDLSVRSLLTANHRTLVRFDLTACSIPSDATIESAELTLHLTDAPTLSRTHDAHRVTDTWAETSVTWTNQPTRATTATASVLTGTTDGVTLEWDVTGDVADFVAGNTTNHGWLVKDTLEGDATGMTATYSAREHTTSEQRPALAVTSR